MEEYRRGLIDSSRGNRRSPYKRGTLLIIILAVAGSLSICFSLLHYRASSLANVHAQSFCKAKRTILLSIDGFRYDYIDRGLTPTMAKIGLYGYQARLIPQFPSYTFPNHYSLVTGLYPAHHGIVSNAFYDSSLDEFFTRNPPTINDPKWWLAAPIWKTAEEAGRKSAVLFWPGCEVKGLQPSLYLPFNPTWSSGKRVKQLLQWIDEEDSVDFLAAYFNEVDQAGHVFGPYSKQVNEGLVSVDQAVGQLLDGLFSRGILNETNIIVVSDHGMVEVEPEKTVFIEDLAPNISKESIWVGLGPVTLIYPGPSQEESLYETIEESIFKKKIPIALFKKGSFPREYHYYEGPRIAPIILECQAGWSISSHTSPWFPKGQHGYNPIIPSIHAIFLAMGPDIIRRDLNSDPSTGLMASNLDLYNLLAALIGVDPKPNNGSRILLDAVLRKR